jgi:hypothetical protein
MKSHASTIHELYIRDYVLDLAATTRQNFNKMKGVNNICISPL